MTMSYVASDDLPPRPCPWRPMPTARRTRRRRPRMAQVRHAQRECHRPSGWCVLFTAFCEIGVAARVVERARAARAVGHLRRAGHACSSQPQFWVDAQRTGFEVAVAIVFGCLLGFAAGLVFWKVPLIGRVFEPYLVSFYAVPLVLFYPVMIVLVGINAMSVIILATIMAAIPMALNTAVGLNHDAAGLHETGAIPAGLAAPDAVRDRDSRRGAVHRGRAAAGRRLRADRHHRHGVHHGAGRARLPDPLPLRDLRQQPRCSPTSWWCSCCPAC